MPDALDDELMRFPKTGRFLEGRLRHDMTPEERQILEDAVFEEAQIDNPTRILEHGKVYDHSTMLIEGVVILTIDGPDTRYGVSFHVPGDFVDLHCFAI